MDELAGMVQRGFVTLENKMDGKFEIVDGRLDQAEEKFRKSLDNQDKILNSVVNLETDNTAGAGASRRQEDKLENHEERIVVVERKLGVGMV